MLLILSPFESFFDAWIAFLDGQWFHKSMPHSPSKNILYVCPSTGIGGAETFLKNTWLGHDRDRYQPSYLAFAEGPLTDWLKTQGAPVFVLATRPRLSQPWTWLKTSREIRKHVRKRNIDLVHSTMAYGALFSALATLGTPHVWFQHGPASGWMDRWAGVLRHQLLFSNSEFTSRAQEELEKPLRALVPQRRLVKMDLGVVPPSFDEFEQKKIRQDFLKSQGLPAEVCAIGMACRLQKWKGPQELIQAVRHLQKVDLPPYHVFIWGDGSLDPLFFQELKSLSTGLPITLAGPAQDIRRVFAACDVVVNASIQPEPFGLTLIEGMSVGAVAVAPAWGGPAEMITRGQDGIFFEPLNSHDLALQLRTLIESKALRRQLGAGARGTFSRRFSLETMMTQIEEQYDLLLKMK